MNSHTHTSDGDWDWDNYSIVMLSQRKDLPSSAMAAVKFNVWCAVGNTIHAVHSHLFKIEVCVRVESPLKMFLGSKTVYFLHHESTKTLSCVCVCVHVAS